MIDCATARGARTLQGCLFLAFMLVIGFAAAADIDLLISPPRSSAVAKAAYPCTVLNPTLLSCVTDANYDRANTEARIDLGKGAFAQIADQYDYLVVFTTFDFDKGGSAAFFSSVRNDVQGIGLPIFDNASFYGSVGTLRGIIDMGNIKDLSFAPGAPGYRNNLNIFAHELMHTFGVYAKYTNASGVQSDDLRGAENVHWNYFLDSDASLMYGADWRDLNGQFQAGDIFHRYSDLDLYLAGFYGANEVQAISLIRGGSGSATAYPVLAATTNGTREAINIAQIVSANGARIPSVANAQKQFRAAFVLLTRASDSVNPQLIASLERFRLAAQERFSAMTHGRGVLAIHAQAKSPTLANTNCAGALNPANSEGTDVLEASKKWLTLPQARQLPCNDPANLQPASYLTSIPAMAAKLMYLREFPGTEAQIASLTATLLAKQPGTMDDAAWLLRALPEHSTALAIIKAAASSNGGFSSTSWFQANVSDTALALSALPSSEAALRTSAISYLRQRVQANNGFALIDGGPSRVLGTAEVIRAFNLASVSATDPQIAAALALLSARKLTQGQYRGGYSDYASIASYTPSLMETLIPLGLNPSTESESYVRRAFQAVTLDNSILAGHFLNDDYTTANAGRVLDLNTKPNLAVNSLRLIGPISIVEGQLIKIEAEIRNDSNFNVTSPFKIQWYDGDPAVGGVAIGAPISIASLAQNTTRTETISINTLNRSGLRRFFLALDTEQVIDERREQDNVGSLSVQVAPAPLQAELVLDSLEIIPGSVTSFPSAVQFRGVLRNLGRTAANQVVVALMARQLAGRVELARATLNVAAQSEINFAISQNFNATDEFRLVLVADPANTIAEENEANNEISFVLPTQINADIEVLAADISVEPSTLIAGDIVPFKVRIRNKGGVVTPNFKAQASIGSCRAPAAGDVVQSLQIPPGATLERSFALRVPQAGAFSVCVELDPENALTEADEQNNVAQISFNALAATQPSLSFQFGSIAITPTPPLQNAAAQLSARAINYGAASAQPVLVRAYIGNPDAGSAAIGSVTLAPMAANATADVVISVPNLALAGDRVFYLRIDPENAITERNESDNDDFKTFHVLSLPDAAASVADIRLEPSAPVIGQSVLARINIANIGEQPASGVSVEVFEASASGETLVGTQSVVNFPGNSSRELVFTWTFGAQPGASEIIVKLDQANTVLEGNEQNNQAALSFLTQSGNQFASELFFSPNGDGVKDSTRVVFRFSQPREIDIRILRAASLREVRREVLPGARSSAEFLWDGKNAAGEIARDGDYRIEATDRTTSLAVSQVLVRLDNNESEVLEALGTPYAAPALIGTTIPIIGGASDYDGLNFNSKGLAGQSYPQLLVSNSRIGVNDVLLSGAWVRAFALAEGWFLSGPSSTPPVQLDVALAPNQQHVFVGLRGTKAGAPVFALFRLALTDFDRPQRLNFIAPPAAAGQELHLVLAINDATVLLRTSEGRNIRFDSTNNQATTLREFPGEPLNPKSADIKYALTNGIVHYQYSPSSSDKAIGLVPFDANQAVLHIPGVAKLFERSADKRYLLFGLGSDAECALKLVDLAQLLVHDLAQDCADARAFIAADSRSIYLISKQNVQRFALGGTSLSLLSSFPQASTPRNYLPIQYDSRFYNEGIYESGFDGLHYPCAVSKSLALTRSLDDRTIAYNVNDEIQFRDRPCDLPFVDRKSVV